MGARDWAGLVKCRSSESLLDPALRERGGGSGGLDGISKDRAGKDLEYFTVALVSLAFTPGAWGPDAEFGADWEVWEEVCKAAEHEVDKQGLWVQVTGV